MKASVLFVVALLLPASAGASGFALWANGASELGECNSVIAHTEGPASNFFNPALLTELDGTHIEIGTSIIRPSMDFKSELTGSSTSGEDRTFYPSTFFISHELSGIFAAGLGINNTFGLATEWPDDWEGRYIATKSELVTVNINPNIAWKISDKLTLAAGVDILVGDTNLKQKLNLSVFGLSDGNQRFKADGEGYGYNLGLLYRITEDLAMGVSYRSKIKLDLDGDVSFALPGGAPFILTTFFPDSDGEVDIDLPAQAFIGISYSPLHNLIFEIGGKWEGWSSYDTLNLKLSKPVLGNNTMVLNKSWRDVYGFNFGVKYDINPTFALSAGYLYEGNPVPDGTFEPSVPSSDRDDLSFGIQKSFGKLRFSVSYLFEKYHSRHKNNDVGSDSGFTANGRYKQHANIVGLCASYRF
ncbi:MAG: outer membrane protein transport protein [Thermodesulfobacteriota bacterium]|nr:outer membrane protein transport protein [Thermodesulfobacteriota bacterium]